MERTLYKRLLEWKDAQDRKPLVLNGARQVGKTWILKALGNQAFSSCVYVNFDGNDTAKELFFDYDVHRIVRYLEALSGKRIQPGKTLLVLDEIQEAPRGLGALKYFCEDMPELHVAAAGSLLGIALHPGTSYPVGKTDELTLLPLSFGEFLHAIGRGTMADLLDGGDLAGADALRQPLVELLRQYFFVGGMPEAVAAYAATGDIRRVRRIQNALLRQYRTDISKHAPPAEVPRILKVFDSLPSQLSRENKKFVYGAVKPGGRAKEFEIAIQWLVDAGVAVRVPRVAKAALPLRFYEDPSAFKLYLGDVGLLGALANAPAASILVGDRAFSEYAGAFAENHVLQQLRCAGIPDVFYWTNDRSSAEIDFILQRGDRILPVEVKAGENLRSKSLRTFIAANPGLKGVRFSLSPRRDQTWMENVPLYAIAPWLAALPESPAFSPPDGHETTGAEEISSHP